MFEREPLISEYSHEKFRPREAEALQILRKVASAVKPIMRQRGWKVGILTEFWPPERNLQGLNWNGGQKICLRLRYPSDERQFLPFEDIVDTMLHELCHIVQGPHNEVFHALWNQLRDEHEALLRKGYTGEGFLSKGRQLGGARIPMQEARRQARAAAEKRKVLNAGSGQRLGGAPVRRGENIRKIIANAAQRRQKVTEGCASDTKRRGEIIEEVGRNGFRTQAEEDDANQQAIMQAYMELVQEEEREKYGENYIPPSEENPSGTQGPFKDATRGPDLGSSKDTPLEIADSNGQKSEPPLVLLPRTTQTSIEREEIPKPRSGSWTCSICTLHNPPDFLCCGACETERDYTSVVEQSHQRSAGISETPPRKEKNLLASTSISEQAVPRQGPSRLRTSRSIRNLAKLAETEQNKPLGWLCERCGAFMENEWWTCSSCGTLKQNS